MFGRLLDVLNSGIDFDAKADFIAACRKLNERRNKIAHRMGTGITASGVTRMAEEYEKIMGELIDCFNSADEYFSWFYCAYLHDPILDEFTRQHLSHAKAEKDRRAWRALRQKLRRSRAESSMRVLRGKRKMYTAVLLS